MKKIHHVHVLAITAACAALSFTPAAFGQAIDVTRIAVLPLAKGSPPVDSNRQFIDCREPELVQEGTIEPEAQEKLTECLQKALEKVFSGKTAPANERAGADELLAFMKKNDSLKAHARKLGQKLQASHVLAGTTVRYRERKGTAYGADRPASVAFSLQLIDVKTGDTVWSGAYDKTQQSLSENLLEAPAFFKTGAKWLTAQELACWGAESVVEKLKSSMAGKNGR